MLNSQKQDTSPFEVLTVYLTASKDASVPCLPKYARLLNTSEYNFVFEKAVRSSDRYFTVLARPNNLLYPRLGMAFTKKRVKLAVARNRLKRISRESFRLLRSEKSELGIDFIVLASPRCVEANNQQLFHSLQQHWLQLEKKCAKLSLD